MSKQRKRRKAQAQASARVAQAPGRALFPVAQDLRLRYAIHGAIRDPRFYMRRDMRAQDSDD